MKWDDTNELIEDRWSTVLYGFVTEWKSELDYVEKRCDVTEASESSTSARNVSNPCP